MVWANFLHFYQPPTQKKYWVDRVTDESYRRLVKELLANPEVRLTLNVNSVLCDLWRQYGYEDIILGIKTLVTRGQIELTGSAKFHPLLPKMPREEIKRQILLNEEGLRQYFGIGRPKGFFPPEMAYDRYVAEVVAEMGYEWILAEELSYAPKLGAVKYDRVYEVAGINRVGAHHDAPVKPIGLRAIRESPLQIFFRERNFSWRILAGQFGTPGLFLRGLGDRVNHNEYLLTAMDGETFGHHRPGMEKQLFDIYRGCGLKSVTISELPSLFPKREAVQTLPSTWALMETEVGVNKPFSRWDDPENEIQKLQWELTELAIKTVNQFTNKLINQSINQLTGSLVDCFTGLLSAGKDSIVKGSVTEARPLLDKALHSDQYWWASARPWWSLEMVERGAYELLEAVKAARAGAVSDVGAHHDAPANPIESRAIRESPLQDPIVKKAQFLYYAIITKGFEWQRTGKVDEISRQEDESVRMLTDNGLNDLPAAELDKMITVIQKELATVVQNGEYERAIQLRDRIKELQGYKKPFP